MKHFSTLCFWLGTSLATFFLLLATGLPVRAQQTEAIQQAAQLALQTRLQWAGGDIPAANFRISNAYTEPSGLLYAYPQQLQAGIPVYNQVVTLVFKDGKLRHHAGTFLSPVAFAGKPAVPTIAAATAVAKALASTSAKATEQPSATSAAGGPEQRQTFSPAGVAHRPIEVRLVWATDKGTPRLAWNVNVDLVATPDWLNIRVDAATGQLLGQDNWTVNEKAVHPAASSAAPAPRTLASPASQPKSVLSSPQSTQAVTSASYTVVPFPGERPDVTTPTTDTNPWLRAGVGNAATTLGWHSDGTTDYTITRGNNVAAYDDVANLNAPGNYAPSQTTSPPLSFLYQPNFTQQPTVTNNRNAAVTNLFYWNNLMHDVLYQYGFTEASGNFQASNLGRGGLGNDYVKAEAQDGGGISNANFSTPSDGTSGRMQMYLFSVPAKVNVTAPANAVASYNALEGAVSTNNKLALVGTVAGPAVYFSDAGSPTTHDACGTSATSLAGKIALISSFTCAYTLKIKAAQTAGAIGVIVLRSAVGQPAVVMGGTDNTITIPAVMVSYADGLTIANLVNSGLMVSIPGEGLDGDFDSGVMTHEYGHGISNRLTGGGTNTSCLYNAEQAGEGWSDFFGLMMTTDWTTAQTTDGTKARPIGTYVQSQAPTAGGIRRYPYSTNMTVDPLTYANMATSTEVHNIGEIWCSTLWDMTWNIIQMQGSIERNLYNSAGTGGNAVALQLVMQGLKLQPCQPGFLDSRDAILAADSLLYGGRYHCAIWGAFARRGMGYSAREGSSNSATDQTVAYDVPNVTLSKNTIPLVGNRFSIAIKANCECPSQQTTYTITDQLPADLQYLSSSPGGTVSGRTVTFASQTFTAGQTRTYKIEAQTAAGKGCAVTLPVNDNRDANTTGLTPAVVSGTSAWAATTTAAHSGAASWMVPCSSLSANATLTSVAFTPGSLAVLSFYHYANLTYSGGAYDGGLVSISTDNGTTWTDAAPYFLQNGYDATFLPSAPVPTAIRSTACFSGRFSTSPTPDLFIQSQLDLSSFTGQSVRVRFQMLTNTTYIGTANGFTGWYLDDVQLMNGCGGNQQVQLLASGNATAVTSYSTPTFLTPLPAPVITSFSPTSGQVGATIAITGTNLTGATLITFGGTANNTVSTGFTVNAAGTSITGIVVPSGAATGPLSVTTPGGVASTSGLTLANFTVIAPTTTVLASSLNPSTVGQQVTLTASVSGSGALPTGSVEFRDGTSLLGTVALGATGQASLQTSSLLAGSRALTATYLGSPTYAGSTGSLVQVVNVVVVTATSWMGTISTDWFTAGNWTAGVPTSTLDAIIPSSAPFMPLINTGAAIAKSLTINSGATLTMSDGTLDEQGTWTNNGTFTATGGTVQLGATAGGAIVGSSPTRFWNLTTSGNTVNLSTSAGLNVQRLLLTNTSLNTNGNPVLLESNASGTAMIANPNVGAALVGTSVTVQRYISPDLNSGAGYRHLASPTASTLNTQGTMFSDLATATYTPVVNAAYNSSATPGTVTPFPNIYAYDQTKLASATNNLGGFDKGWQSPTALSDRMSSGLGYTVNVAAGQTVAFKGQPGFGDLARSLTRNAAGSANDVDAGWNLLGNPYPSPYDYSLQAVGDRANLDAAIYLFESTGQYVGNYRAYTNGVGSGNPILAMGQAFFARVSTGQTSGTLTFRNANRVTTYTNLTYHRTTTETRPLVQLTLTGTNNALADDAYVYFEQNATDGLDAQYDALKLPNSTGLNLSTSLAATQLAIDGRAPLGTAQRVLPLAVGVPAAGVYTFTATQLLNLGTVPVYLRDLQLGTLTDLRQQPTYQFTVGNASALITSRFELVFSPQQALATVPAALAQQVAVYPNPAHTQVAIDLPLSLSRQPVTATLLDALGRVVQQQVLPAGTTTHTLPLSNLAAGVYALRLTTDLGQVVKKLVIE
ncbi:MAG: M36 family metallopeptidase [Janthinobacterium lividum]